MSIIQSLSQTLCASLAASAVILGMHSQACAENPTNHSFRVAIKLFQMDGEKETPMGEHLILFDAGVAYDLDESNGSMTVFDIQRQRVMLLDRNSKVRTTINTNDLTNLMAKLRTQASSEEIRNQWGLDATVTVHHDGATEEPQHVIQFKNAKYSTTTQSPSKKMIAFQFAQFADWASRLNAARRRGLPPFARMTLNQELAETGLVPKTMKLKMLGGRKRSVYLSKHDLVERLSDKDRRHIDEIGTMLALYEEVSLKEFPE